MNAAPEPSPPRARPPWQRGLAWLALAAVLAAGGWWWWAHRKPAAAPAAATRVTVAPVKVQPMPVLLQSVGTVVARASVEVRPQTGGVLRRVLIADGDRVTAGQRLFTIDDSTLAATLAQAQAQYARDRALADDARAAAARLKPLADKEYVTAREYESAVNTQHSLEATAAATRTQIDQARIALGYAAVTAPISGRAGAVLVKPGALVTANNATALVVINAMSPVDVSFTLPQSALERLRQAMAKAPGGRLRVEARESQSQKLRAVGELVFLDNALNDTAGTITLKARFPNTDEALWPGEFCAVRLTLAVDEAAVVIPESALQQGQDGPFVYVVEHAQAAPAGSAAASGASGASGAGSAAGMKATVRKVRTDRVVDGLVVVAAGLRAGERIVTAVPATLRDGAAVAPAAPGQGASAPASAPTVAAAGST